MEILILMIFSLILCIRRGDFLNRKDRKHIRELLNIYCQVRNDIAHEISDLEKVEQSEDVVNRIQYLHDGFVLHCGYIEALTIVLDFD